MGGVHKGGQLLHKIPLAFCGKRTMLLKTSMFIIKRLIKNTAGGAAHPAVPKAGGGAAPPLPCVNKKGAFPAKGTLIFSVGCLSAKKPPALLVE